MHIEKRELSVSVYHDFQWNQSNLTLMIRLKKV